MNEPVACQHPNEIILGANMGSSLHWVWCPECGAIANISSGTRSGWTLPQPGEWPSGRIFIVFRSELDVEEVVGVTSTEHLARKLARRTMMPGADSWLPRTWSARGTLAVWENPAKHEYVFIERHDVDRKDP